MPFASGEMRDNTLTEHLSELVAAGEMRDNTLTEHLSELVLGGGVISEDETEEDFKKKCDFLKIKNIKTLPLEGLDLTANMQRMLTDVLANLPKTVVKFSNCSMPYNKELVEVLFFKPGYGRGTLRIEMR